MKSTDCGGFLPSPTPLSPVTSAATCEEYVVSNLIVEIPDDIAGRLSAAGGDLSRRAREAFPAEEYKHERLTKPELQQLLGIETSYELDGFLKAHDVWIDYTSQDVESERQGLQRLAF